MGTRAEGLHRHSPDMTLQAIASQIETQILKGCGAAIEWTFRSSEQFTISGECVAVNRAVLYCIEHGLCRTEDDTIYDEELNMSFAYMKAA
jgi:hypothetical protein